MQKMLGIFSIFHYHRPIFKLLTRYIFALKKEEQAEVDLKLNAIAKEKKLREVKLNKNYLKCYCFE